MTVTSSTRPAVASGSGPEAPTPGPLRRDGAARVAGRLLIAVSLTMLAGAAAWSVSGVDLDGAVQGGQIPEVLPDIAAASGPLTVMASLWLTGMVLYAIIAAILLDAPGRRAPVRAAVGSLLLGAALAATAFASMLTLVNGVAATPASDPAVATAVAWYAVHADWIATILVVGVFPALLLWGGHGAWAPQWTRWLIAAVLVASVATLVSLITGSGLATFGFALVPVGLATTITTGALLWRRG